MTPRPGAIVAWWNGGELAFGLVASEEKERLRLIRARGRDERVMPTRVAAVIVPTGPVPGHDPETRGRAAERVAVLEGELRERAQAIDVETLWQIALEAGGAEGLAAEELAAIALEAPPGEAAALILLALSLDGVHFVRRAERWLPRPADAVRALKAEREATERHKAEREDALSRIAHGARTGEFTERGTEAEREYLWALERVAVQADDADSAREQALSALERSGVSFTRPHDGAFRLLRRLGRFGSDDENLEVRRFGLRTEFPEAVLSCAERAAEAGFEQAGRVDLTGLEALTIDGPSTREIDDALSIERRPAGGFRLGVHIADPAAFVLADDAVDREALARGLTHYMPDLRLPMLPPAISEQAASLVPDAVRPALSFLVELDCAGEVERFELTPSLVRSRRRLSYDEADLAIRAGEAVLVALAEAGLARRAARARNGAAILQAPEVDVHVDEGGEPVLERLAADSAARLAVSEAMVLVGELAARSCAGAGLPAIYRRQAPPASPLPGPIDGASDPLALRRARRQLRRAESGLEPGPHSGLGLAAYVQVSSPLRRYQDLAIHRQLVARHAGTEPPYDAAAMRRIAASTERAEAEARRAEESSNGYWLLRHLARLVGQSLPGVVVEVDPRPIVLLEETQREYPVPALSGLEPGASVRLAVVKVEPRAGLVTFKPVD